MNSPQVASVLGYKDTINALKSHVDNENKTTVLLEDTGSNYKSKTGLINESGMYSLIRTVAIEDEPWFVGKDVAEVLGYSNTRKALIDHVDSEDKNSVTIRDGIKGNPNKSVINESGLYSLILSSKLPEAKEFKHWVTSEVLPSIRKHGTYMTDQKAGVAFYHLRSKPQLRY
ncbi:hypothetical protein CRI87_12395 [Liquorilactobacillus satsumensis]|nr:hypothetical protein [Liquorilactobacillus satsumensis]